jgi:death-on-curing protein
MNHAFVDGNKRIGHYAMETFLVINGSELAAPADEQEAIFLQLASGKLSRDAFTNWIREHIQEME